MNAPYSVSLSDPELAFSGESGGVRRYRYKDNWTFYGEREYDQGSWRLMTVLLSATLECCPVPLAVLGSIDLFSSSLLRNESRCVALLLACGLCRQANAISKRDNIERHLNRMHTNSSPSSGGSRIDGSNNNRMEEKKSGDADRVDGAPVNEAQSENTRRSELPGANSGPAHLVRLSPPLFGRMAALAGDLLLCEGIPSELILPPTAGWVLIDDTAASNARPMNRLPLQPIRRPNPPPEVPRDRVEKKKVCRSLSRLSPMLLSDGSLPCGAQFAPVIGNGNVHASGHSDEEDTKVRLLSPALGNHCLLGCFCAVAQTDSRWAYRPLPTSCWTLRR